MNIRRLTVVWIPIVLYCLVGLGLVAQGIRYLGGSEIAPYHVAVIDAQWDEIGQNLQRLLLGLYRGFGVGFVCVGVSIIVLAVIPLRMGNRWSVWAIFVIAGTYTGALIYVTSIALKPGAEPIGISITLFSMVVVAAGISFFRAERRVESDE